MANIIKWEFCDGTVSEYEADDSLYAVYQQLDSEERNNHKRETRRHVLLSCLNEKGVDIEAPGGDPLSVLIRREESAEYEKAFAALSADQRELLEAVYIDGKTMADISREEGVDGSSVRHRMMRAIKKLKKFP